MAEFVVKIEIPEKLKIEMEESGLDISGLVKQLIVAKVFEMHLSKSTALQRALFETIANRSKLNEKDATELADLINRNTAKQIKEESRHEINS